MKKYISLILSLVIAFSSFCISSVAKDAQGAKSNTGFLIMLDICENENLKDDEINLDEENSEDDLEDNIITEVEGI